ncbi:Alpha/Beta hydrolase protein [Lophiotrema nucula]|uniref:Alpha/Beta hydrolase protein n=1 Tax=Lophiotrema nucula TaxID=690887 RepID=A0A6A5ZFD6_9PLEO|nr:Alpha/Beta hydrolase protein [Lophiotrema nucula]
MLSTLPILAALLGTAPFAAAAPNGWHQQHPDTYAHPSNGNCEDYTVKESITSPNLHWAYPIFKDNYDVAGFLFNMTRKDRATTFVPFDGIQNVTDTYEVSGTFCSPKTLRGGKEKTVLVATHGLGYDRRYWASTFEADEYNYVQHALGQGYSVFYYDRLGTGKSQKISGFVNQAGLQTALLGKIVAGVRSGKYAGGKQTEKIVLVGHSFGSYISNALIAAQPDIVEGAVLTGISYAAPNDTTNASASPYIGAIFALRIASTLSKAFATLDTGYLGFGDIYTHIQTFFHQPNYAVPVAQYAQSISQPLAIAELLSLNALSLLAPEYKGKVLVTTGEFDFIVCSGECKSTFKEEAYKGVFNGTKDVEGYVHPGAGHGVNFGANATGFYDVIGEFLDKSF